MNEMSVFSDRLYTITDEDIEDIMSSAFTGINYWCSKIRIAEDQAKGENLAEHVANGGTVILWSSDDDDDTTWHLDKEKLKSGIDRFLENTNGVGLLGDYVDDQGAIDVGRIDAEAADAIVQYALFSDIVFA